MPVFNFVVTYSFCGSIGLDPIVVGTIQGLMNALDEFRDEYRMIVGQGGYIYDCLLESIGNRLEIGMIGPSQGFKAIPIKLGRDLRISLGGILAIGSFFGSK